MKHPAYRVRNILHLDREILFSLRNELRQAAKTLPFDPTIEICGSYAIGCARIESDIDVNLGAKTWDEQVAWRRLWENRAIEVAFQKRLKALKDEFQIKIEVAPCCPDNKAYNVVYDVIEGKVYGVQGEFSLKWHPYQFKWEKGPPKESFARFQSDPFKDVVNEWRERYQDHFIELEKKKDSLFQSCLMEKGAKGTLLKRWLS